MIRACAHRLSLAVAVLAVALASVVFAARMAPAAAEAADLRAYLAMGGTLDELCAGEPAHHAHHCPVCNLLPETPAVAVPQVLRRVDCRFGVSALRDLALVPFGGNPRSAPRAPPALS